MNRNQFKVHPNWHTLINDTGINPEDVLRLAGLPLDLFSRKNAMVDPKQYLLMWEALELADGTDSLPLKLGRAISIEAFDPAVFASLSCQNLNVALQRLSLFRRLIGPMHLQVAINANTTEILLECHEQGLHIPVGFAVTELVFITQLARIGTHFLVQPQEVALPEMPARLDEYTAFFGVEPILSKNNVIKLSFSNHDGVRPFLNANDSMSELFEEGLRQRLSKLDATASISERVKAVLLQGLPAGQYSINEVAKQLALNKRTLQRYLNEEKTIFSRILISTRQQLAVFYLSKLSLVQTEIAYLLGFQDESCFNRAFKCWTGVTPGIYRHHSRNGSKQKTDR